MQPARPPPRRGRPEHAAPCRGWGRRVSARVHVSSTTQRSRTAWSRRLRAAQSRKGHNSSGVEKNGTREAMARWGVAAPAWWACLLLPPFAGVCTQFSIRWCVHPNIIWYFFISSNSIHQFHLHPNNNIGIKANTKASQIWYRVQFNTKSFNVYIQTKPNELSLWWTVSNLVGEA